MVHPKIDMAAVKNAILLHMHKLLSLGNSSACLSGAISDAIPKLHFDLPKKQLLLCPFPPCGGRLGWGVMAVGQA